MVDDHNKLIARDPKTFKERYAIDVHLRHRVTSVDPHNRSICVVDLDTGTERTESYDHLLLATGSRPVQPFAEAKGLDNLHIIKSLASGIALKQYLDREQVRHAVIVGGGYIGIEIAEALLLRGIQVTMLQRSAYIMHAFDPSMSKRIADGIRRHGVTVMTGAGVKGFEIDKGKARAVIAGGQTIPADLFILGMGVTPNTELAQNAGLQLGPADSIQVNEHMQTSAPDIWAAGDCCQSIHLINRQPVYIPLGTTANKQGRTAGINIGGGDATFPGVLGTAITKFQDTECACTGLNTRTLEKTGIDFVSSEIDARTLPGYYPETAPLTVKLLADRKTARILGGQIVGGPGSAKRIDTLVVALHAEFTLEDMLNLDLSYAPPFANVWDPMVIAAREALKQ
ncbi:FAD-dependent oxidoreductase [Desulfogranum japonicum]|uniref:FAD-dependent oxidoreductase n=1 Tax=Desulfogranum japonicum TaxID=231447 RepID=UPI000413F089|nr:FAD-dependent oxidoreductase [Desulfogranum japonicum]